MKTIKTCFVTCIYAFIAACTVPRTKCEYPISFQLSRIYPGDKLNIHIDDSLIFEQKFDESFIISQKRRHYLLNEFCSTKDSLIVYINLNENEDDTTLTIHPRLVKSCVVGDRTRLDIRFEYRIPGESHKDELSFE